tara:strand:- start:27072 stop:27662 length:591 start_codon:yes stop_codon:yes gene_type:complete
MYLLTSFLSGSGIKMIDDLIDMFSFSKLTNHIIISIILLILNCVYLYNHYIVSIIVFAYIFLFIFVNDSIDHSIYLWAFAYFIIVFLFHLYNGKYNWLLELDIKNVLFISSILFVLCFAQKIEDGKFKEEVSDKKIIFRIILSLILLGYFFIKDKLYFSFIHEEMINTFDNAFIATFGYTMISVCNMLFKKFVITT